MNLRNNIFKKKKERKKKALMVFFFKIADKTAHTLCMLSVKKMKRTFFFFTFFSNMECFILHKEEKKYNSYMSS